MKLIILRFVFTNCFHSCTSQNNYDLNVFFDLLSNSCSPWKCSLQSNERFNNNVWFPITCCFDNKLLIQVLASPRTDYSHFCNLTQYYGHIHRHWRWSWRSIWLFTLENELVFQEIWFFVTILRWGVWWNVWDGLLICFREIFQIFSLKYADRPESH